jgi:sugar O-acyltransferase (sialic acid O-acetyltransferase NeuD family)
MSMGALEVKIPRVNANEDEILVTDIHYTVGDNVKIGDVFATAETTKAAIDIEVQEAGHILKILRQPGSMIEVGATIAVIDTGGESVVGAVDDQETKTVSDIKITTKAKLLAKELGVDMAKVKAKDGRIGIAEVKNAANGASCAAIVDQKKTSNLTQMKAVIVGGGGHSATIAEIAISAGWNIIGAVDKGLPKETRVVSGVEVIDSDSALQQMYDDGVRTAFIGIGGPTSSTTRTMIYEKLQKIGFSLPPLVHPSAHFGTDIQLGPATYVLPNAMIGPRCKIGANVIVNSSSVVAHDCTVEDHVHLAPASVLAGNVTVGTSTVVGMNASILYGVTIGANCLIHNNVSVFTGVSDNTELSLKEAPVVCKVSA